MRITKICLFIVFAFTASIVSRESLALASYSVRTAGFSDCLATNEGLPADQTSSSPGVTVSHSNNQGSEFESWFANSNQHSLRTRTRASQGGFNESPALSCASAAALFTIDDLIFTSETQDFVDVSLAVHYEGTLFARSDGSASAGANLFNLVTLDGDADESGNSSGLEILNQANSGLFRVGCTATGCFDEDGTTLVEDNEVGATSAIDAILTHTWTQVPVDTLVSFTLGIQSSSSVQKNFNDGGEANSFFHETITFANPGALFGLGNGVTANSEQLGLVNNSIESSNDNDLTVPEPSTLALFGLPLVILGLGRLRRRRVI